MTATIKVFRVGAKSFRHVMNTRDDSVELHDENGVILLVYGPDAKVNNQDGHMGFFHPEYVDGQLRWVYYERALQTRIVLGPDLHSAEVEVSRRYIDSEH